MSWGYRITVLYLGFVALIATLIVLAMRQQVDLVAPDYYEQELRYQEKIDLMNRTQLLEEPLSWEVDGRVLHLHFPAQLAGKTVGGSIFFFRPSDARLDQTLRIPATLSGTQDVSLDGLERGVYRMQISWKAGDTSYYSEGTVQLH